jgi:hypothetical protein
MHTDELLKSRQVQIWRVAAIVLGSIAGIAVIAVAVDRYALEHIAKIGGEQRVVFQLDAPYGSVDLKSGTTATDIATIETMTEDGVSHSCQWSYGLRSGGIGMLRIGLGTDEGMRSQPPIAMWHAHSGYSPAAAMQPQPDYATPCLPQLFSFSIPPIASDGPTFRVISTDAGTLVIPEAKVGTRISLSNQIPIQFSANLGLGESNLDLTGLSLTDAIIETGASKAIICSRQQNPVAMHNCIVSAGIGLCTFTGISNLNTNNFTFNGAVGSYHLGFEGKLNHNMDATVEVGLGMCTISIPPTAARVQVFYDDGFLSSVALSGLSKIRDGYATSPGFRYSSSPVLTLHLSSGAGKISVSYH